jgi:hypothetical protein
LSDYTFIVALVVAVFAFDWIRRWWRENEWRRKWRDRPEDD